MAHRVDRQSWDDLGQHGLQNTPSRSWSAQRAPDLDRTSEKLRLPSKRAAGQGSFLGQLPSEGGTFRLKLGVSSRQNGGKPILFPPGFVLVRERSRVQSPPAAPVLRLGLGRSPRGGGTGTPSGRPAREHVLLESTPVMTVAEAIGRYPPGQAVLAYPSSPSRPVASRARCSAARARTATAGDVAEASSEPAPAPPGGGSERIRRDPQTLILSDPAPGIGFRGKSGRGLRQRAGSGDFDREAIVFAFDNPIVCV